MGAVIVDDDAVKIIDGRRDDSGCSWQFVGDKDCQILLLMWIIKESWRYIFHGDHAIHPQKLLVESCIGPELDGGNKEDAKVRSWLALNLQVVQDDRKLQIIGPISVCFWNNSKLTRSFVVALLARGAVAWADDQSCCVGWEPWTRCNCLLKETWWASLDFLLPTTTNRRILTLMTKRWPIIAFALTKPKLHDDGWRHD